MHFLNTYTVEDFVLDDAFRRWVLQPGYETEAMMQEYLLRYPQQKKNVEDARVIVLSLRVNQHTITDREKEELYNAVKAAISNGSRQKQIDDKPKYNNWRRFAAAAMLMCVAGAAVYLYIVKNKIQQAAQYTTQYAQVKRIVLPDSSVVTLNANSALTLKDNWNDSSAREVWLKGEAFFEVTKKPNSSQKNFIVHTPDMNIQVLGTKFDVKTGTVLTRVVLTEGRVNIQSVRNLHSDIIMAPGDAVELKKQQVVPVKTQVRTEPYHAWKEKKFLLNKTTLKEIATFTEEYYGTPVRFENETLEKIVVDGTSLPLDDENTFLKIITEVTGTKFLKSNNEIIIRK
jgi:transmembrane sensor